METLRPQKEKPPWHTRMAFWPISHFTSSVSTAGVGGALTCCISRQDVKYLAISGFLFLRFFAPAILTPKLFDLRDQHADPQTGRSLLLLAKVPALEGLSWGAEQEESMWEQRGEARPAGDPNETQKHPSETPPLILIPRWRRPLHSLISSSETKTHSSRRKVGSRLVVLYTLVWIRPSLAKWPHSEVLMGSRYAW